MNQSDSRPEAAAPAELFSPMRWREDGVLELLDQTRLPAEEVWLDCRQPEDVAGAIRRLSIRGAPAIGVAAAYGLVLGVGEAPAGESAEVLRERFDGVMALLGAIRPTAINLVWALERGWKVFEETVVGSEDDPGAAAYRALFAWAKRVHADDVATNRWIGEHGAVLFATGDRVLTHCNTGALATASYGTALGVIQSSWRAGKVEMV